jgi:hypothetical protein
MDDQIEDQIGAALKPQEFGKRPRVFPVVDTGPSKDFEPVRTITQFLVDIETNVDATHALVRDQEKLMAEILKGIMERLGRIENTIGVR